MTLVSLILTLIVVGVLLWLVNTYVAQFMAAPMVKLINIIVVIVVVLWLLSVFGLIGPIGSLRVPTVR